MPFFEVSCKCNINIEEAFLALARKIREQRERRVEFYLKRTHSVSKILTLLYFQGDNFDNDDKNQDKKSPGDNHNFTNKISINDLVFKKRRKFKRH